MDDRTKTFVKNMLLKLGNPITVKLIAIGVLTLLLLKPAAMIESLIQERETRQKEVEAEIGSKWGRAQTITGPLISVPLARAHDRIQYVHFLPDALTVTGKVDPHIRYRGIFEAALYNAQLVLTGSFSFPRTEDPEVPEQRIEWSGALISIGISDIRGIGDPIITQINDTKIVMDRGIETHDLLSSGVTAPITIDRETRKYSFRIEVNITGSEGISFTPVGKATTVSLSSDWPNPSFGGAFLPSERSIKKKSFTAKWKVHELNRKYPQQWIGSNYRQQVEKSAFGVGLFTPVDYYQKSMRATKYAILFIVLTFSAFFISELVAQVRLHPVQYLLIGLVIITFYTLLLSLSEHISFLIAYLISSTAVILLVTAYAKSILGRRRLAIIVGGVLTVVYAYSYWLLQMVDYALVAGSVGLFIVLAAIMYVTRRIDWYAIRIPTRTEPKTQPAREDEPYGRTAE